MKNKQKYKVIGLMSGTSLDGLDMAYCEFEITGGKWAFTLLKAQTINYPDQLLDKLKQSTTLPGLALSMLDVELGKWIGHQVMYFIKDNALNVDLIASHGHTVFHQIERNLTSQIGNGNVIAAITNVPVVYDFRSLDVALGGHGAPLVPIGDKLLFHTYDYCLNLGGIANISYEKNNQRLAFDICPCNMALNHIATKLQQDFDKDGVIAKSGTVIQPLLEALNNLDFYYQPHPKSLGFEWVQDNFFPLLEAYVSAPSDLMRTVADHIVVQIINTVEAQHKQQLLITGGGAFNLYLINKLREQMPPGVRIIIPEVEIINYKEAIVFGFLGVLRVRREINCLSSVTGASRDNCGGVITGEG